jgi:hypothetical protein
MELFDGSTTHWLRAVPGVLSPPTEDQDSNEDKQGDHRRDRIYEQPKSLTSEGLHIFPLRLSVNASNGLTATRVLHQGQCMLASPCDSCETSASDRFAA